MGRVRPTTRGIGCLVLAVLVLAGAVVGIVAWVRGGGAPVAVPAQQRCVATAGEQSVSLDLDQAYYSAVIVGLAVKRGLPPRAGSIAMATVYQETGIRNLDYGDRDSVGLFQQRPSQGWGTEKQLMDPYYATGKFYDALVKIKGWRSGDINDMAQKVQVSGHPEAYRDHVQDARVLGSTLSGETPAGFTCLERAGADGDAAALAKALTKTLGLEADRSGTAVTVRAGSVDEAWAAGSFGVATAARFGVVEVVVGSRQWVSTGTTLPAWEDAAERLARDEVRLTVR
jgi:hypothetical protein